MSDALKDMSDIPRLGDSEKADAVLRLRMRACRPWHHSVFVRIAASVAVVVGLALFAAGLGLFSLFKCALSGSGGKLQLNGEVSTVFVPTALNRDWYACESKDGYEPDENGVYAATIGVGNDTIDVSVAFAPQEDGSLIATYGFVPRTDIDLKALCVRATLPLSQYAGAAIIGDGLVRASVPEKREKLVLFNEAAQSFRIKPVSDAGNLELSFDGPVRCFCQDNRMFDRDSLTLRIFAAGMPDGGHYLAGKRYEVRFRIAGPVSFAVGHPVKITRSGGWVPVAFSGRVQPGSALDFSALRPTGSGVGEYGRVVARNGHFEFKDRPGVSQRFWGVNLNYGASTPPEDEAGRIAERLARLGYNSVRFHHHDGVIVRKAFCGVELDEAKMRRMDAFVAACARWGIYVSTDLFVSRTKTGIPYRALGIDADGNIEQMEYKELLPFHEGVASNYFEFVRAFLNHVNAFTGVRYADDPAIAFLSLVNENEVGNFGIQYFARHGFMQQAWADWLADRRRTNPVAYASVPADVKPSDMLRGSLDSPAAKAFVQFAAEAERRFALRAKAVICGELNCRALLTDLNGWQNRLGYQPLRAECLDYVDTHFYIDHPAPCPKGGNHPLEMRENSENPVRNGRLGATGLAPMRIFGKPFVLSEFNCCAPGRFRALGNLAFGSMAALQDWSGLWRFTYGHSENHVVDPSVYAETGCFNGATDPVSIAADKAMFALFARDGLKPLSESAALTVPASPQSPLPFVSYKKLSWDWISWYFRTGTVVGGSLPTGMQSLGDGASAFVNSSEEMRECLFPEWKSSGSVPVAGGDAVSLDPTRGAFEVSTPCCSGGFAEHGDIRAGGVRAEILGGAAGVWAVSLDGEDLAKSHRMLVVHVTDAQNSDAVFADGTMGVMLDRGHAPMLMRPGRAVVTLDCGGTAASVFALADDGRRLRETPSRLESGRLTFTADIAADPDAATIFYEVTVK